MFDPLRVFYISFLRRVFESMSDRNIYPSPAGTAVPFSFGSNYGKSWKYCSESLFVVLFIAEQSCQFLDLQD